MELKALIQHDGNKKIIRASYITIIGLLALFSIVLVFLDYTLILDLSVEPWQTIDCLVLILFALDYFTRLFISKNKKQFLKSNIFDLLAILPINQALSLFRVARIFRVVRLARLARALRFIRILGFIGILKKRFNKFLHTNGFNYVLYSAAILIFLSSLAMSFLENKSFGDALWWSIVTTTTVGYGDISPNSILGRIVAIILMLFGIGLIGMLTGTITTYFTNKTSNPVISKNPDCSALIKIAETLNDKQLVQLTAIAQALKSIEE